MQGDAAVSSWLKGGSNALLYTGLRHLVSLLKSDLICVSPLLLGCSLLHWAHLHGRLLASHHPSMCLSVYCFLMQSLTLAALQCNVHASTRLLQPLTAAYFWLPSPTVCTLSPSFKVPCTQLPMQLLLVEGQVARAQALAHAAVTCFLQEPLLNKVEVTSGSSSSSGSGDGGGLGAPRRSSSPSGLSQCLSLSQHGQMQRSGAPAAAEAKLVLTFLDADLPVKLQVKLELEDLLVPEVHSGEHKDGGDLGGLHGLCAWLRVLWWKAIY